MKLGEIAELVSGELKGDPELEIKGASGIHEAGEGEITFLSDRKLTGDCIKSRAAAVLVREFNADLNKPQVITENPYYAFARLLEFFYVKPLTPAGISSRAFVSDSARLGAEVTIHPFAYISEGAVIGEKTVIHPGVFIGENTAIGAECVIYPNVTLREGITIGSRVIIHPGAVIGSDGFGYVPEGGRHYKIPQVGGVILGDEVEIGANVTIDRATTGQTRIGSGTKIDNLVQVGHNVRIGENSIVVAHTAIGGSTKIGKYVVIGGLVGIADHAEIDDGCIIGSQSGIMGHLSKGVYFGSPAIPHRDWLKASVLFARLPQLNKRIKELEDKLNNMDEGRQTR